MKERQCRICGEWKPVEVFGTKPIGRTQIPRWCPPCHNEWNHQYNTYGIEKAQEFVAGEQAEWNFVKGHPTPDKITE